MSVLGRNWRFLTISAGSSSIVRGKTGWIRKPPFYPLNYGNSDICDCRFLIADCKLRTGPDLASDCCCDVTAMYRLGATGAAITNHQKRWRIDGRSCKKINDSVNLAAACQAQIGCLRKLSLDQRSLLGIVIDCSHSPESSARCRIHRKQFVVICSQVWTLHQHPTRAIPLLSKRA